VWAEPFGLGELALTPDQFWRLTPREFQLMRDGFFRREDRAWQKLGILGTWVLAPYSKQRHSPERLLGRGKFTLYPSSATDGEDDTDLEVERARVLAQALAWAEGD
jgi:hypothetical protein